MTKHIGRALVVLTGTMLAGAMLATPASAATTHDDTELPSDSNASEHLDVTITVTGNCTATITYTNNVPDEFEGSWAYWGDYRVGDEPGQPDSEFPDLPVDSDGDLVVEEYQDGHNHKVDPDTPITSGPLAGQKFGLQYNPVLIHRGDSRTKDVVVDAPTTLAAWIKRGPDQPWYVGEVAVEVPCEADDDNDDADNVDDGKDDDAGTGGGDADDSDTLPVTGAPAALIAGAGAALLGAGLVLRWALKRRAPKFVV